MKRMGLEIGFLATLLFAGPAAAGEAEERAITAILKLGGKIRYDEEQVGRPVIFVSLDRTKVSDTDLQSLAALKQVRWLMLNQTEITDAGLRELATVEFGTGPR